MTDDVFIVDQHAADEKYNFETLQLTTKIDSQKLFRWVRSFFQLQCFNDVFPRPLPLELTAAAELTAMENIDILRQNGFEVSIDEADPEGGSCRLKLVAQPVSKSTIFNVKGWNVFFFFFCSLHHLMNLM
jgi:DNA mismatch repair protein PMS2